MDDLLTSPANLCVLRTLWGERRILFPVEIVRRTKLSRTSVHVALARLVERRVVERIAAWDSGRTFGYRLVRRNPIVKAMEDLFRVEARIPGQRPTVTRRPGPHRLAAGGGTTSGSPRPVISASMSAISRGAPPDISR